MIGAGTCKSTEEELEELRNVVELLNESCRGGAVILVEGESDMDSIRLAGVEGEVLTLHRFHRSWNRLEETKIIALLDLDREGEETLRRIKARFEGRLHIDESARNKLRATKRYKKGLRTIPQLFSR